MQLVILTRPDIAYPVSNLSQFDNSYSCVHWNHVKGILRYLAKSKDYCVRYGKEKN